MVYKSRPSAGAARLAWDTFTILHDGEPVSMEAVPKETAPEAWQFRYLDAAGDFAETQLAAAGLEVVTGAEPDQQRWIRQIWRRAEGRQEKLDYPRWANYVWLGMATLTLLEAIWSGLSIMRQWSGSVYSDVRLSLVYFVISWLAVLGVFWRNRRLRRQGRPGLPGEVGAACIYFAVGAAALALLRALGGIAPR